jgi:hypothetical protein
MRTLKIYFVRIQMKFGVVRYAWLFVLLRVRACVQLPEFAFPFTAHAYRKTQGLL